MTEWDDIPSAHDSILAIEMIDKDGRSRTVALHRCLMPEGVEEVMDELAQALDGQASPVVAAHRHLWPAIATAFAGRVSLSGVELVLSPTRMRARLLAHVEDRPEGVEYGDFADADYFAPYFGHGEVSLAVPALTLICIDASARLERHELEGLVGRSGIALPLETLTIDKRITIPDACALSDFSHLARSVVFAECELPEPPTFPPPFRSRQPYNTSSSEAGSSDESEQLRLMTFCGSPGASLSLSQNEVERTMRQSGIVLPVDTLTIEPSVGTPGTGDLSALSRSVVLAECHLLYPNSCSRSPCVLSRTTAALTTPTNPSDKLARSYNPLWYEVADPMQNMKREESEEAAQVEVP
ncbi:hypothetical protein AURDEDRAFT_151997 [Auricularia subglabra TFB-10046 SS5]|nr:hypothetical protein AURDEDRAFT_151997 [Auricularia subglabra TFB-10046 SS5]